MAPVRQNTAAELNIQIWFVRVAEKQLQQQVHHHKEQPPSRNTNIRNTNFSDSNHRRATANANSRGGRSSRAPTTAELQHQHLRLSRQPKELEQRRTELLGRICRNKLVERAGRVPPKTNKEPCFCPDKNTRTEE